MIIYINGSKFGSLFRAMDYAESLGNDITLQVFDNGILVYNKHYETFSDFRVVSQSMHFYHNGDLVLAKHVFSRRQACDIIDLYFRKYGAFNYDLQTISYLNGHRVDGTLAME